MYELSQIENLDFVKIIELDTLYSKGLSIPTRLYDVYKVGGSAMFHVEFFFFLTNILKKGYNLTYISTNPIHKIKLSQEDLTLLNIPVSSWIKPNEVYKMNLKYSENVFKIKKLQVNDLNIFFNLGFINREELDPQNNLKMIIILPKLVENLYTLDFLVVTKNFNFEIFKNFNFELFNIISCKNFTIPELSINWVESNFPLNEDVFEFRNNQISDEGWKMDCSPVEESFKKLPNYNIYKQKEENYKILQDLYNNTPCNSKLSDLFKPSDKILDLSNKIDAAYNEYRKEMMIARDYLNDLEDYNTSNKRIFELMCKHIWAFDKNVWNLSILFHTSFFESDNASLQKISHQDGKLTIDHCYMIGSFDDLILDSGDYSLYMWLEMFYTQKKNRNLRDFLENNF